MHRRILYGLALITASLAAQTGSPLPLLSAVGSHGFLVAPQTPVTLTTQVTDRSGTPLPAMNVIFIAPPDGSTGAFQNASFDGATWVRATTDSNGRASAVIVPNTSPGVFLVEAALEETPAATSFAISTLTPDTTPALNPDDARSAVVQRFLANITEDELVRLHGPLLLPAGTVLSTGDLLSKPFTLGTQSWFLWLDPHPPALFSHPSQFILLDASNPSPDFAAARVTSENFWPILGLPGSPGPTSLLPPSRTNFTLTPAPAAGQFAKRRGTRLDNVALSDTCAIVVYGENERVLKLDAENMTSLFVDTLGIPTVLNDVDANGNPQPSTVGGLQSLIVQSVNLGCKKVFLYIVAHGGEAGRANFKDALGGNYSSGVLYFSDRSLSMESMATLLKPYKASGTELCLIVTSCFSGNIIPVVQNLGISGLVVTATDRGSFATANLFSIFNGTHFSEGLITVWKSLLPGPNNPVGLDTAMATLQARGAGLFPFDNPLSGNPQVTTIDPKGGVFPATDLTIPSSSKGMPVTLTIKRPPGVTGKMGLTIKIADATVATVNGGAQTGVVIVDGADSTTVMITGLRDGATTYTLSSTDNNNKTYMGTAKITVGDGYSMNPNPLDVNVGQALAVTLTRDSSLAGGAGQMTFTGATNATLSPNPVTLSATMTSVTIMVTGVAPGTATFTGTDTSNRKISFVVNVHGTIPAACPSTPVSFNSQFGVVQDLGASARFANITSGVITVAPSGNTVKLTGDRDQVAPATGPFNPATCSFTINGVSTGPIAGFNNVHVTYKNMKIGGTNFDMLTGEYDVATQGDFNGEPAIVYSVTGTKK